MQYNTWLSRTYYNRRIVSVRLVFVSEMFTSRRPAGLYCTSCEDQVENRCIVSIGWQLAAGGWTDMSTDCRVLVYNVDSSSVPYAHGSLVINTMGSQLGGPCLPQVFPIFCRYIPNASMYRSGISATPKMRYIYFIGTWRWFTSLTPRHVCLPSITQNWQ